MQFDEFDEITRTDVIVILASLSVIWGSIGFIAGKFVF
jgi:hypothetical protein